MVNADQADLFGAKAAKPAKLEVHEHIFISGPRARGIFIRATQKTTSHFSHSHEGGDIPHTHPDTGPGSYVIDKDDWFRQTGLRGGRKKFTVAPSGEQMPMIELTPEENTFEVIVGPPPKDWEGTGGGMATASRMILGLGMNAVVRGAGEAA